MGMEWEWNSYSTRNGTITGDNGNEQTYIPGKWDTGIHIPNAELRCSLGQVGLRTQKLNLETTLVDHVSDAIKQNTYLVSLRSFLGV